MSDMPYMSVNDNELLLALDTGETIRFPDTRDGARQMGQKMAELKIDEWLCSSSVDYPDEGKDTEREWSIRTEVEAAITKTVEEGFKAHISLVAKEEGLTEEQVRKVLARFGWKNL